MLAGIFVGGAARRMNGVAKGLLDAGRGETIVARLARIARENKLEIVLVGAGAAYDALALERLTDAREGAGPLAGLVALLEAAKGGDVVVLACDMPAIAPSVIEKLAGGRAGVTIAPKRDGRWEPLCARYAASVRIEATERLARGALAMHALLDAVNAEVLPLDDAERATLLDWDSPEDVG